ncbi:hypothetical protein G3I34_18245 [Streptomyces sp. SID8014]|uniref:hypothetical protein n=1 Tax=Streptomyces sp. SID8014 TaxID=2706097 RepID=UPI0013BB8273|nr:hypothetical protein [Streptomyces sp. SID8014]NEC14172.1 hypothetical protein [Streptomyces sp. SID8014]
MTHGRPEEWMSRARTPQTRARIRRWARLEDLSRWILSVGAVAFAAAVPAGIGLALWFWIAGVDRFDVFAWLYGSGLGVLLIGTGLGVWTDSRLVKARFADGRRTVGVIGEVVELPETDVDGNPAYHLLVSAEIPGRPALRRTIDWGSGDSSGPDDRWAGRAVCFRHNTFDPDDEHDVLFDGWPEDWTESRR